MEPTLRAGDQVLLWRGARIRVGDLVLARLPGRPVGVKRAVRRVPAGWELRGDNPGESTDSRHFGPVPAEDVLARVVWRYWPPRRS